MKQLKDLGAPLLDVVDSFREDIKKRLFELEIALNQNNLLKSRDLLHTLKGTSLTLGAKRLSELCRELEFLANNDQVSGIKEKIAQLSSVADETIKALEQEFSDDV